jgi:TetR/AcrR family transcriptional repressor of nem operon
MARNVEFNRNEVLENAMETFWRKGYSMTSIPNLVEATKLNPGSIYAAFNSKEGLFLETLNFYGQRSLNTLQQTIAEADSPLTGIKNFITALASRCTDDKPCGCLLVNTLLELSSHNPTIQAQANKQLKAIEAELYNALKEAQKTGELPKSADTKALSKYLMVNIWGLRVLAKTRPNMQDTKLVLEQILASLNG